jgi:hypothetical protein
LPPFFPEPALLKKRFFAGKQSQDFYERIFKSKRRKKVKKFIKLQVISVEDRIFIFLASSPGENLAQSLHSTLDERFFYIFFAWVDITGERR